jgi:hypothetical protein
MSQYLSDNSLTAAEEKLNTPEEAECLRLSGIICPAAAVVSSIAYSQAIPSTMYPQHFA